MRVFCLSLAICLGAFATTRPTLAAEPVPIGAVEVLTGPSAAYGLAIADGLKLALDEVNKAGVLPDRRPLALTIEDSAGQKDQAVNAMRLVIGRDHVVAVIGPTLSNEMFAAGPIANAKHIPTIGTSTTARGITDIGPYIFRTSLPEAKVVPVTMAAAKARGVKTIGLIYANDDAFSKSSYDSMRDAAVASGLTIVDTETFGGHDTDLSAQMTKLHSIKPDAIGIAALVEPTSGAILAARQAGIGKETLLIGGNGANSPKLGAIAGEAADGMIVGTPWFVARDDAANVRFVAAFRDRYGHDPDQFAAQAYDTLHILARAIDDAGAADPDRIRDALQHVSYSGVTGPFRFDEHRDPASNEGVVVVTMQGGHFVVAR